MHDCTRLSSRTVMHPFLFLSERRNYRGECS
nr:MAG TPA: hypothetical protein [Caudoviricetes sp.]DAS79914.1 MAG TPA: hypothetical protein [Caudoviricetes sp.]